MEESVCAASACKDSSMRHRWTQIQHIVYCTDDVVQRCVCVSSNSKPYLEYGWHQLQRMQLQLCCRQAQHRRSHVLAEIASSSKQFATLQFLRAHGCVWNEQACDYAAEAGALQSLQWLREQGCEWNASCILYSAACSGSVELAAWVKAQPGVEATEWALNTAAKNGDVPMCRLLRAEQCPWSESTTSAAAPGNQIDTLNWLQEQGCPWSVDKLCIAAAEGGSIEVLEHLQQHDSVQFSPEQLRYC
jgi:hypothetical protein